MKLFKEKTKYGLPKYKKQKRYRCDPDKNKECMKTYCYRRYPDCCWCTFDKKYRMNIFKRIKEWFIYGKLNRK